MKKITDLELFDKKVLIRCDFNVPMQNGSISETARIDAALETINFIKARAKTTILCSHLGSPRGEKNMSFSLLPVYQYLKKRFPDLKFVTDYYPNFSVNDEEGLILLENLRFYKEEEANEESFSKFLASLCDVYVNDAFSASHREHSSIVGVCRYVKEKAGGLLLCREVEALDKAIKNTSPPVTVMLGGLKVSTKLPLIKNLVSKVDYILVGGAMANTFWSAQGLDLKACYVEREVLEDARWILTEAKKASLLLAKDFVFSDGVNSLCASVGEIPDGYKNYDIGPQTCEVFKSILSKSKTIIWNGPLGMFEQEQFSHGTKDVIAHLQNISAFKIAGGGDTVSFLTKFNLLAVFDYVSLAGGAFLEYLELGTLPGLDALEI
ncbi:MAG: phosphoglycerate kinase [Deltaproteobacteria bacterium]|nr:phosphoglycerate kinase [Deltaproteobacteria bacterium]MCX7953161.1 phosphoglycerate kinase [Deltaproteobacteria bacterium]